MAFDINTVLVVGRLTRDPELKTAGENQICKFSIASNNGKEDKDVSYFDVTAWNKTAENINQYLKKGSQVLISGQLKQGRWTDKNGDKKSKVEINARQVQFLGAKSDSSGGGQSSANPENDNIPF